MRAAILELLAHRDPPKTICPSEVARALAPDAWRPLMARVREAAFALAEEGLVEITQRGAAIDGRTARGPIRIRRAGPPP